MYLMTHPTESIERVTRCTLEYCNVFMANAIYIHVIVSSFITLMPMSSEWLRDCFIPSPHNGGTWGQMSGPEAGGHRLDVRVRIMWG